MKISGWYRSVVLVVIVLVARPLVGRAAEPPEVQQARQLIADNARAICYFALPTYKYVGQGYNEFRRLGDGFEVTFTFECKSSFRTNTVRMAFLLDQSGNLDYIKVLRHTSYWTPFTDAVGKKELAKLRHFANEHPVIRDSRELMKRCDGADARGLCELYLKVEQARRAALSAGEAAAPGSVKALFVQVAPVPARPRVFERGRGSDRAVVLLHGYRPELDDFRLTEPALQDWQEPESLLVKVLSKESDVYAFAYGQTVAVERVAAAPELKNGVARLKAMGYREIVLLGYSAGGLVARYFAEDGGAAVGVTRVVQVCTPNGGVIWGKAAPLVCRSQQPFVASLTSGHCRLCQMRRDGCTLPREVEWVCVVGDAIARSDWVISCRSQWSPDLQAQGVPAVRVKTSHLAAVQDSESILAVARVVREPAPRWDRQRVELERASLQRE